MSSRIDRESEYMTPALAKWRAATDWPLLVLAIGSLPILLLEVKRHDLPRSNQLLMDVVNMVVLVAFAIDYIVELRLARQRAVYVRAEYLSLLIVISQVLTFVPHLAALGALRSLRAVRLVRPIAVLLRAWAIGGSASRDGRRLLREHAAGLALGIAGMTWLMSAAAFTIAEDVGRNGRLDSFSDSLWWSLETITTVGYGDVYPVTSVGRIIGGFTMIVGISTFALVTARIARFLVRDD